MDITGASGHVKLEGGAEVTITGGSGVITVTGRTETRIMGTFTAMLTGEGADSNSIQFSAEGSFDTGAPVGPQADGSYPGLRGSPIPGDLLDGQ